MAAACSMPSKSVSGVMRAFASGFGGSDSGVSSHQPAAAAMASRTAARGIAHLDLPCCGSLAAGGRRSLSQASSYDRNA